MRSFFFLPALCCLFSSLGFSATASNKDVDAAPQLSEGVTYGGPILNDDAMHIQLGADYILWLVTQEGLNTAFNNITGTSNVPPVPGMGTTYGPHFKVRSGFKVHADVVLKERRRLILLPREAPLHLGHLRNMASITEMGGIIYPPVPAFYQKPDSIAAMVDETVGRVLDLMGIETALLHPWRSE